MINNQESSTAPDKIPILKIQGLCKDFPPRTPWGQKVRVVDNVDMEIARGEIRGIVGESGSGKTTLARCCLRLIEPSSGTMYFDGQDLSALTPPALRARRRDFQMIFQDVFASLNPDMTVEEILLEPLEVHQSGDPDFRRSRVRELMETVSLSHSLLDRRPAELSGGQQQRVGIARGLALNPRLLLADEPVSALDTSVQAQVLNLLADLKKKRDLTMILISHSLYAVHYLCTHVSVMFRGRVVEEAPAAAFFSGPRHPYSRALFEAMPVLDPFRRQLPSPGKMSALADGIFSGCVYCDKCPDRLPICADRQPQLLEIHPGGKVACFLFQDRPQR
jgi:oligopeptide/dipeptide ABC transporter ATP-binding protein